MPIAAQQQPALLLEEVGNSGTQELFYKQKAVLNTVDNHIYTCGSTLSSSGTYDILLTKHNGAGVWVWSVSWSGSGSYNDYAADITFDAAGNLLVVGSVGLSATNTDAITLKYNTDGTLLWSATYSGAAGGPDALTRVLTDGTNNVYVCGGAYSGLSQLSDMLLIKYSAAGAELYTKLWNNSTSNLQDVAFRMILSGSNIISYGASQIATNPVQWRLAAVSYNQSSGNLVGSNTSYGDDEQFTEVHDIQPIGSNHFIVAGSISVSGQGKNARVIRFNQELTAVWDYQYNGSANGDDAATSVEISGGWLYVGGYTTAGSGTKDLLVTKRNHTTGAQSWVKLLDLEGEDDEVVDLAGTPSGDIYLCATSHKMGQSDYAVAKLNTATGNILAQDRWGGMAAGNDRPTNMVVGSTGDLFVAGQEQLQNGGYRYALARWSEKVIRTPQPTDGYSSHSGYIKNNGQLRSEDGTSNTAVKYYNESHRVATYIDDTKISYQLAQAMDTTNQDTLYRVDMTYSKGLQGAAVYATYERKEYHNYYLGHMASPSVRTGIYNTVIKPQVYTGIDALYTHSASGFRHWLVLGAGSSAGDIEMSFAGQTGLSVDGAGRLQINTTIGQIIYTRAKAYTMNTTTGALSLLGWQPTYSISGSSVSFTALGSWSGVLVLEFGEEFVQMQSSMVLQNVDWSTMFGGQGAEQFKDVVCNNANYVFAFGDKQTNSIVQNVGITIGSNIGNTDVMIVKFNSLCQAIYMSYYGGSNHDYCRGGEIDTHDGELYCVGVTTSSNLSNIPVNMEDNTLGGSQDGFYTKFNGNGQLLFHTYVGGNGLDGCNSVSFEYYPPTNTNLIYYVGQTNNGVGWPAIVNQPNSQNMGYAGGQDGFIIKRSGPAENVVWSTFFGSDQDETITDVDLVRGSPVIVGITNQETYSQQNMQMPMDGKFPKAHGPNWNSDFSTHNTDPLTFPYNYFVAYFGDNGQNPNQFFDQLLWCTYLCPSPEILYLYKASIFADNNGFGTNDAADLFITGQIPLPEFDSDLTFPLVAQGWHQAIPGGGGSDAFLMKFRMPASGMLLLRSTLFGGSGDEIGAGFAIDANDNVYMCGEGEIPAIQPFDSWCGPPTAATLPMCDQGGLLYTETNIVGNNNRAWVCAFRSDGQLRWITQYGAGNLNAANAMCASNDKVWLVGHSSGSWTFEEFDDESNADYFRILQVGSVGLPEATIARFDIPLILDASDYTISAPVGLMLYPNPAESLVELMALDQNQTIEFVEVLDPLGKLVEGFKLRNTNAFQFDVSSLPSGLYHIRCYTSAGNVTLKLIKN